jgi:hypothetical protein
MALSPGEALEPGDPEEPAVRSDEADVGWDAVAPEDWSAPALYP